MNDFAFISVCVYVDTVGSSSNCTYSWEESVNWRFNQANQQAAPARAVFRDAVKKKHARGADGRKAFISPNRSTEHNWEMKMRELPLARTNDMIMCVVGKGGDRREGVFFFGVRKNSQQSEAEEGAAILMTYNKHTPWR